MRTIYDAIRADHAEHRQLLERIADTSGDSETRRACWKHFYYDVKAHAAAEEETFYSKLMADPAAQGDARHSVHEHQELDELMDELDAKDFSSPGWLQRFRELRESYEHHMEEEENDLFPRARKVLDDDGRGERGAAFARRKAAEVGRVDEKDADKLEH